MTNQSVNLVVALAAEAVPLIECFELKPLESSRNFRVYGNEQLQLAVSGMGKQAAESAVHWLHADAPESCRAWLNIGIAGHGSLEVGDCFLANRITDHATGKSWYPVITFAHDCRSEPLMTVEKVETNYPLPVGYDMEASSYMLAANRYATAEIIHSYKIVSDNPQVPVSQITPAVVSELVRNKANEIKNVVNELDRLVHQLKKRQSLDDDIKPFLERWKFTVTQKHQLKHLLQKNKALGNEIAIESESLRYCQNARVVIKILQQLLDRHWMNSEASNV